jgi:hypothetical protein
LVRTPTLTLSGHEHGGFLSGYRAFNAYGEALGGADGRSRDASIWNDYVDRAAAITSSLMHRPRGLDDGTVNDDGWRLGFLERSSAATG